MWHSLPRTNKASRDCLGTHFCLMYVAFDDKWSVFLFMDTADAEWKQCQRYGPPGSMSAVVAKYTQVSGEENKFSVLISKSFVCPAGFVHVFVTYPSCFLWNVSCRGPSLQVWSRLLRSSPHPEAGAGHPHLTEEGQPGQTVHLSYTVYLHRQTELFVRFFWTSVRMRFKMHSVMFIHWCFHCQMTICETPMF